MNSGLCDYTTLSPKRCQAEKTLPRRKRRKSGRFCQRNGRASAASVSFLPPGRNFFASRRGGHAAEVFVGAHEAGYDVLVGRAVPELPHPEGHLGGTCRTQQVALVVGLHG